MKRRIVIAGLLAAAAIVAAAKADSRPVAPPGLREALLKAGVAEGDGWMADYDEDTGAWTVQTGPARGAAE